MFYAKEKFPCGYEVKYIVISILSLIGLVGTSADGECPLHGRDCNKNGNRTKR